jgi:serine/threonine protein kinase
MPATACCPPVRALQKLAQKQLEDWEARLLADHLDQCERCLEIMVTLQAVAAPEPAAEPAPIGATVDPQGTWKDGIVPARAAPSGPRPAVKTEAPLLVAKSPPPVLIAAPPALAVAKAPPAGLQHTVLDAPALDVPKAPVAESPTDATQELLASIRPAEATDELGRLGPYRLLKSLGAGAAGIVFLAEDIQLRRQVALKVMRKVPGDIVLARQRFLREAQAAAVLDHENILTIYQVGEDRDIPYLAMKLLQGETLDARLKREKELLVHEALRIGQEIAEGLDAAHERGLIHRDIKPANIFLEGTQARVKIVDFGLARAVSDDEHLTRTGTVVGTPAYMSPEQARGGRLDHRSDLFSLGCVLYRMLAGRTPFQADDTMGMLMALAQDTPPPIRALNACVPHELAGVIMQLLAKSPEARPQSARSVADRLAAIARRHSMKPESKPPEAKSAPRPLWITVCQLVALAAVAFALFWFGPPAYHTVSSRIIEWLDELPTSRGRP